jgi:hypothetical protein
MDWPDEDTKVRSINAAAALREACRAYLDSIPDE